MARYLAIVLALALGAACTSASEFQHTPSGPVLLLETFENKLTAWTHSGESKYIGKFRLEGAMYSPGDKGMLVPEKALHYGIATKLAAPAAVAGGLVLQYEAAFQTEHTCAGAYVKFLEEDPALNLKKLDGATPYSVMFGPDKCGSNNKVHLIIRHKSPKTGLVEEKHLKYPPMVPFDKLSHVYTAIIYGHNNSYAVLMDGEEKKAGSLLEDFEPPFLPPAEIDDPEDTKPADWVDVAKIPDPAATKPEDWDEDAPIMIEDEAAVKPEGWLDDEPVSIDDPAASQPADWDEGEDGAWEPPKVDNPRCKAPGGCGEWKRPKITNPAYKGKWAAPLVDNPEYKGPWAARKIPNPAYYTDDKPLVNVAPIGAAAVEIWTMDENILFDNLLITVDPKVAADYARHTWRPKHKVQQEVEAETKAKKDAEAEKDKDAGAKDTSSKDADSGSPTEGPASKYAGQLLRTLEGVEALESVMPYIRPGLKWVKAAPLYVLIAAAAMPVLLVLTIVSMVAGEKKEVAEKKATGKAKKTDAVTADDKNGDADEEEEEEEEEEKKEKKTPASRRKTSKRAD